MKFLKLKKQKQVSNHVALYFATSKLWPMLHSGSNPVRNCWH